MGDGYPPILEGCGRETRSLQDEFRVLLEHLVEVLEVAEDVVVSDTAEPDLGLEFGSRFGEQDNTLVGVDHAADVLCKSTFKANIHRAHQAARRERGGVARVKENGTLARML